MAISWPLSGVVSARGIDILVHKSKNAFLSIMASFLELGKLPLLMTALSVNPAIITGLYG